MEINRRTRNTLENVFYPYFNTPKVLIAPRNVLNYADNNIFNRFWEIDLTGDRIEYPVFFGDIVNHCVVVANSPDVAKLTLPIYIAGGETLRRTGDSIVNACMEGRDIIKVTTNKDEVYYVGKGIIFDAEFQILMLCTKSFIKERTVLGTVAYNHGDSKCYIHPNIFSDEDLMSKTILKKIVPFYLSPLDTGYNCKVSIKDMTRNLIIPSVPDMNTFSQETVNSFLKEHVEEITTGVLITKYL